MPIKDLEKRRESARLRYYKNRDRLIEYQRLWDADNKDKKRLYDKKRRVEKGDNQRKNLNHYSKKHHFPVLLKKYGGCQLCDSKKKLELHHKRYTKKISDVMLLCQPCHKKLHRHI